MATFVLTVVRVRQIGGKVYVDWSDGVQTEYANLAEAVRVRDRLAAAIETLRDMAIARYLRLDPTGVTPSLIEGHTITYSDTTNQMVVVS